MGLPKTPAKLEKQPSSTTLGGGSGGGAGIGEAALLLSVLITVPGAGTGSGGVVAVEETPDRDGYTGVGAYNGG